MAENAAHEVLNAVVGVDRRGDAVICEHVSGDVQARYLLKRNLCGAPGGLTPFSGDCETQMIES